MLLHEPRCRLRRSRRDGIVRRAEEKLHGAFGVQPAQLFPPQSFQFRSGFFPRLNPPLYQRNLLGCPRRRFGGRSHNPSLARKGSGTLARRSDGRKKRTAMEQKSSLALGSTFGAYGTGRDPCSLARPVGLEPTAYRFEVCRSIQLSYGRAFLQCEWGG